MIHRGQTKDARIAEFAATNPMRTGSAADLLALIPFAILITILYMTGREKLFAPARRDVT